MNLSVILKTRSNFKNLNGKTLKVKEIHQTRVSIEYEGSTIDFNIDEVVSFHNHAYDKPKTIFDENDMSKPWNFIK